MSRHRSPGDRPTGPLPLRRVGSPRHAMGAAAVRNGMAAAAVTGGALAVIVPLASVPALPVGATSDATTDATTTLALTADGVASTPEPPALLVVASLEPVTETDAAPDPALDAAGLLKAVGLADLARRVEEERLAREAQARCDADLGGLGAVKPWVRDAARFLACLYDQPDLGGVANRSGQSDHPAGLAVDLMVDREQGDRIAECTLNNQSELGVTYVIWRQRVNYGDGWEPMSDRGGDTANHYDHVHVSFERAAPTGTPEATVCT